MLPPTGLGSLAVPVPLAKLAAELLVLLGHGECETEGHSESDSGMDNHTGALGDGCCVHDSLQRNVEKQKFFSCLLFLYQKIKIKKGRLSLPCITNGDGTWTS